MYYIVNTVNYYINNELVATDEEKIYIRRNKMSTRCYPINFGFKKATTSVDGNKLLITPKCFCPEYIVQGDRMTFAITECIDYPSTAINNAILDINGSQFTLIRDGDVKWDQIKPREAYTIVFGTEGPTATILNKLICSKYDYPIYDTTSTTAVVEE